MSEELDDESRRILQYLLNGTGAADESNGPASATAAITMIGTASMIKADENRETAMRIMGLNRREREQASRRRSTAPQDPERSKTIALKRIGYYIDTLVDWSATDLHRTEVIAAWAALAHHDVDLVNRWWSHGVHPLRIREVTALIGEGFAPTDLFEVINGRTILQHLDQGSSVAWCTSALRWARRNICW